MHTIAEGFFLPSDKSMKSWKRQDLVMNPSHLTRGFVFPGLAGWWFGMAVWLLNHLLDSWDILYISYSSTKNHGSLFQSSTPNFVEETHIGGDAYVYKQRLRIGEGKIHSAKVTPWG